MITPEDTPLLGHTSRARILVVDDERKIRESLCEGLKLEGWTVQAAGTGADAVAMLCPGAFELVVLDWMLPDLDGIEVVRRLRARKLTTAVLMVTARGAVADRVAGIDCGADDYLVKPFAFAELVARCRALLRRLNLRTATSLRAGRLELDTHARVARRGSDEIALSPLEVDLLEYLMRRCDQTVTRDMLARDVWRQIACGASLSNAINIHVARLRQKIEREEDGRLIVTEHGVGYRFNGSPDNSAGRVLRAGSAAESSRRTTGRWVAARSI